MEATYHNCSIDLCNAIMMEVIKIEKHIMKTTRGYLPISQYNVIMLLMENEKQMNLETLCNNFPFFLYKARMLLMGKEKHINMETTCNQFSISLYIAIMLLMESEYQMNLETFCNNFPFFLYKARMLLMGYEKHINMEITCNNFSISLYNAMMLLMGKEEHIKMRRAEIDIYDQLYNEACGGYKCRINTGSRKEGFRRYFSDLDCFGYLTRHRVVWSLTDLHSYDTVTDSVILVQHHPTIPGTVYLCLKESFSKNGVKINRIKSVEHFIRRNMYIRHNGIFHGKSSRFERDLAVGFACGQWPLHTNDFMARCRKFGWPPKNTLENMLSSGCFFAPIGSRQSRHDNDPNSDKEWRLSFVQAEQLLVCAMNHCQFLCYALLKVFIKKVLNKKAKEDEKLLCSYYIKTAMFWCIQTDPGYEWSKENFFESFWKCYKLLLSWVYAGYCPNFFIPQNNLFVCKILGADQERLFTTMYNLYCSGKQCFSTITRLQTALEYGAKPKMTELIFNQVHFTDRLIAEAIIDINILQCQDITYAWKALDLYKVSPIDTSNFKQILITMHVFNIFHDIALSRQRSCHCKTKCKNNRQIYKKHKKVGIRLLNLTSKYGPASDPLYLALFWYIDGNYSHSLHILKKISRILYQDHVFFWDNDPVEQSYTRKMQGKPMSVRMKEGMAFGIYIYSISGFSELNIEIRLAEKPENPACLIISPFVFTEFLIFLCHHRLKNPNADRSIHKLHSFLKRDDDRYVGNDRDIAWDILGICHQLSGNLGQALSAYEESLKQTNNNNINEAVEERIAQTVNDMLLMHALIWGSGSRSSLLMLNL